MDRFGRYILPLTFGILIGLIVAYVIALYFSFQLNWHFYIERRDAYYRERRTAPLKIPSSGSDNVFESCYDETDGVLSVDPVDSYKKVTWKSKKQWKYILQSDAATVKTRTKSTASTLRLIIVKEFCRDLTGIIGGL